MQSIDYIIAQSIHRSFVRSSGRLFVSNVNVMYRFILIFEVKIVRTGCCGDGRVGESNKIRSIPHTSSNLPIMQPYFPILLGPGRPTWEGWRQKLDNQMFIIARNESHKVIFMNRSRWKCKGIDAWLMPSRCSIIIKMLRNGTNGEHFLINVDTSEIKVQFTGDLAANGLHLSHHQIDLFYANLLPPFGMFLCREKYRETWID